jgi:hypothetical protein
MVNAGVYMVARANPIFSQSPPPMWVVASIGVFTAIFAAAIALTQNDIKKVLAYSTVSQLAYMFLRPRRRRLGVGDLPPRQPRASSRACCSWARDRSFHGAGGEQDMRFMGNLRARCRGPYWTMVIGSLALAGIPSFAGFLSKDEILAETFNHGWYVFYGVGVGRRLHDRVLHVPHDLHDVLGLSGVARARSGITSMRAPHHGRAARHPRGADGSSWACCLGIPPRAGVIHTWLEPVFHGAEEAAAGVLPGSITATGHERLPAHRARRPAADRHLHRGRAGVWLAYRWYVAEPEAPARFVERIPLGWGPGLYAASVNKSTSTSSTWRSSPAAACSWARRCGGSTAHVIDGAVNGAGWLSQRIGSILRRLQTGRTQNYGLGIAQRPGAGC